jgi:hypothetical protein
MSETIQQLIFKDPPKRRLILSYYSAFEENDGNPVYDFKDLHMLKIANTLNVQMFYFPSYKEVSDAFN